MEGRMRMGFSKVFKKSGVLLIALNFALVCTGGDSKADVLDEIKTLKKCISPNSSWWERTKSYYHWKQVCQVRYTKSDGGYCTAKWTKNWYYNWYGWSSTDFGEGGGANAYQYCVYYYSNWVKRQPIKGCFKKDTAIYASDKRLLLHLVRNNAHGIVGNNASGLISKLTQLGGAEHLIDLGGAEHLIDLGGAEHLIDLGGAVHLTNLGGFEH